MQSGDRVVEAFDDCLNDVGPVDEGDRCEGLEESGAEMKEHRYRKAIDFGSNGDSTLHSLPFFEREDVLIGQSDTKVDVQVAVLFPAKKLS